MEERDAKFDAFEQSIQDRPRVSEQEAAADIADAVASVRGNRAQGRTRHLGSRKPLLVPDGVPATILWIWRANHFPLFTSPAINEELSRIAALPRIRRKYDVTDQQVADLLELLAEYATLVDGTAIVTDAPLRDANDFIILAAAADAEADLPVTSDQDLLVLGAFRSTVILTPRAFIARLADEVDLR